VLDHHKSAQAALDDLPYCVFDMKKSGAVMAWEYFHCSGLATDYDNTSAESVRRIPALIRYICDRDLWQWKLTHSKEVSAALAATGAGSDFRTLISVLEGWESDFPRIVQEGSAILAYERDMVERIAKHAEEVEIDGMKILAACCSILQSEVGEALAIESASRGRAAAGACYYRDGEKKVWRVSLRSRDAAAGGFVPNGSIAIAPDVSVIAKKLGGGGHAKAAAFECVELPWAQLSERMCRCAKVKFNYTYRTGPQRLLHCSACGKRIDGNADFTRSL
jgi:oligoribonuclease NrnB/cAMP/cGMP phosphodiesterase (DHH superfamily)